jgi:hypothetical protein
MKSVDHQDREKLQRNGYLWQMLGLELEFCFEAFMRDGYLLPDGSPLLILRDQI